MSDISYDFTVPAEKVYVKALKTLKKSVSDTHKKMLDYHVHKLNRVASYGELADAAGLTGFEEAIAEYEQLGKLLGEKMNMGFMESVARPGEPFYASALGGGNPYKAEGEHYLLALHYEFVAALMKLKWVK
ncbi:MAG: hypothetical protein CSB34_06910 [Desulfobulbus propionicus]|nr:MAG: hypothetical protein CSB34_06910 [Desulfobulbus propionicus]